MSRNLGLIACLLLLSLAASQPAFTCTNSVVPGIASGIVRLGVPTAQVAQTAFSVSLASFNLGTYSQVHSAFAIAGFQGASSQQYFSLVVDQVVFNNGNTQMNFTMNYANPTGSFQTTWSSIKLSWVAISTSFYTVNGQQYGNYVYATSIGLTSSAYSNFISGPQMINSIFSRVEDIPNTCGYINKSPAAFDVNCAPGNTPRFVTHLYIMGFKFNPSGNYVLAASVLRNGGTSTTLTDTDEALTGANFVTSTPGGGAATNTVTGPNMLIDPISSQLDFIKVGIVITTILDVSRYPATNPTQFQYAGVYMNYTFFNSPEPIIQAQAPFADSPLTIGVLDRTVGGENYNYFTLLTARYQIYGLSSFYIATLPASVTVVNYELSLPGSSTVIFQTDNVNYMTLVRISADQWTNIPASVCAPTLSPTQHIVEKYYSTVPTMQTNYQTIYEPTFDLTFNYFAAGSYLEDATAPLSSTVIFSNILKFEQVLVGSPYRIDFTLDVPATGIVFSGPNGAIIQIQISVKVEGNEILSEIVPYTVITPIAVPITVPRPLGFVFSTTTPVVEVTITFPRFRDDTVSNSGPGSGTLDRTVSTTLVLTQYSHAYNPITDCCDTTCPVNSGLMLPTAGTTNPPICVLCAAGLIYNSVTRLCQCQTGYYPVVQATTNQLQCFPCYAQLCQSCNQTTRTTCNTCVTGAIFNANTVCECTLGFFQNGAQCTPCASRCASCSVATVCLTCADTTTRDVNNDCVCLTGFFDAGSAICATCPVLCQTCSSATTCLTCFTQNNRALVRGQCVCATGFFQVVAADGSLSCQPCHSSCTSCSLTADHCTNCNAADFRILGYDSTGAQVCNCIPGYSANSNNQCVQSNCVADPYCSTCLSVIGVSQCIKCIAATNRVLVLPDQRCFCKDGYYDNAGICVPCGSGCQKCSSANTCSFCVASANTNNDGTCTCPNGYFFQTSPIRYCKRCPDYTLTCLSSVQALTCVVDFQLVNGVCTCPSGRYINSVKQCQPCVTGCAVCSSSTSCQSCNVPLLLQGNTCVSRCGPGYFQNGFVCTACSAGCALCSGPNICLICLAGQRSYNGFCHQNCPPGSVPSNSSTCVDCNSPCKTCTDHPSKCTSCKSCCGNLFSFKCLDSCPVGTYSINGTCQYCAYNCKSCLGSNTTCTSCPAGKILYNGACFDTCPYIMIGGICTFNCAKGLYKTAMNECKACDSRCATCVGHPSNCTTCKPQFGFALQGVCQAQCPANYLSIDGECKACNPECKGCTGTCDNCIACSVGFYKLGSKCVKTCYPNMFIENNANICVTCSGKCKTCSSLTFCTTCANPQAVPVNGVCNDCSYPCNTCTSSPSTCTSCVTGFNLIGTTCIAACPTGAFPKNGVCQCSSGAIFSNQCVSKCPIGYGNIGGQCTKCADNCASCDVNKNTCVECLNGYALDQVAGICQKAPSCQFGQYFSQSSNACTRICPTNTYFYENVCLTACLSGYNNNGVGGCEAATPQTGCSFPYFLSNGVCVSNCPSGAYPDTQNRVCKGCSSNCFSCLTNTFCYACNAGYDLNNGICIASTLNCPAGQFRYNGVCYTTCPTGTCAQGNFCQRTCPAGTWSYNGGCYRTCPTKLTTADACVDTCPSGTSLVNGVCQVGSQACPSGQYWDGTSSSCRNCQFPCTQCSLTASYCTACSSGLSLNQNMCVASTNNCGTGRYQGTNGNCMQCDNKCAECISAGVCSSCSSGYNFNGNDCVKTIGQLQSVTLTIKSTSKRGNSAFVTVCPNILPNGLSMQQQNNFFSVVPASADKSNVAFINQWLSTIDQGCVTVGINYNQFPVQSAVFLAINAQLLANSYMSMGYVADASSFVSAAVNINLPQTPANVVPPSNSAYTKASAASDLNVITANVIQNADVLL